MRTIHLLGKHGTVSKMGYVMCGERRLRERKPFWKSETLRLVKALADYAVTLDGDDDWSLTKVMRIDKRMFSQRSNAIARLQKPIRVSYTSRADDQMKKIVIDQIG